MKGYLFPIFMAMGLTSFAAKAAENKLQDASFKVGLIYPKTGPLAPLAESEAKAVRMGLEEFRQDHPELAISVAVVVADDKSLASEGAEAAERLIEKQKVNMIIGSYSNTINQAFLEAVAKNHVPLLLIRPAGAEFAHESQVFSMTPTYTWFGRMLGYYAAQSLKKKRVAILLHDKDPIAVEMNKGFVEAYRKAGGFIVGSWTANQQDVWDAITQTEPDAYFIPAAFGKKEALIDKAVHSTTDILSFERFFRAPPTASALFQVKSFTQLDPHKGVQDFVALYEKKYQAKPDEVAAAAYESIRIILQAYFLSLSVKDNSVFDTFRARELGGIYGLGRFTGDRFFMRPIPITKIQGGKEEFRGRIQPQ